MWVINILVPFSLPQLGSVTKEVVDIQGDSNIGGYGHLHNDQLWLECYMR